MKKYRLINMGFKKTVVFITIIGMILSTVVVFAQTNNSSFLSLTIRANINDIQLTQQIGQDGNLYDIIELSSGDCIEKLGQPSLPSLIKQFVIPYNVKVKDIDIIIKEKQKLPGEYNIFPEQEELKTDLKLTDPIFIQGDKKIYNSNQIFPMKSVDIVNEGFFGNDHIIALSFCPFQYIPNKGKLQFLSEVQIQLSFETTNKDYLKKVQSETSAKMHDSLVRLIAENDNDMARFRPEIDTIPLNQQDDYLTQYLIITNEELAPAFELLQQHKTKLGIPTEIVLVSDIEEISWGEDTQAKIRNYIKDRYATDDIVYVLLGGNETIVPVRYAYNYNTVVQKEPWQQFVCDLYYSDLTGEWEVDGDGIYGEPNHDDPDIYPEVFVGRIPASYPEEVIAWTNKLITFEMNPSRGIVCNDNQNSNDDDPSKIPNQQIVNNYNHLTKALFIAADHLTDQPALVSQVFPDYFFCDIDSCVEYPSGSDPNPTSPHGYEVINTINQGWQFINVLCHGNPDNYASMAANLNEQPKSYVWGDRERIDGSEIPVHNGALSDLIPYSPTITYSIACDNAWIDWSNCPYGWIVARSNRSMGEAAVLLAEKADVAYIGNSRYGWVGTSYKLMKSFYQLVFDSTIWPDEYEPCLEIGVIHNVHKVFHPTYRDLNYGLLLLGDPSMRVWSQLPELINCSVHQGLSSPEGLSEYTTFNTNVPGSRVCLRFPTQSYYEIKYTDDQGIVRFHTPFTEEGRVSYIISKPNFIPLVGSWWNSPNNNQP